MAKTTFYVGGSIYEKVEGEAIQKEITIQGIGRIGIAYTGEYINALDYHYELSDHLGNVRAVIRKVEGTAEVLSYVDYFPFGWQMPNRNQQYKYRYAYQGQENPDSYRD